MKFKVILLFLSVLIGMEMLHGQNKPSVFGENEKVGYVGTYTTKGGHVNGKADGIYLMYLNPRKGSLKLKGTVAEQVNPSFVKKSKDGKNLYAVSEFGRGSGNLYSYKIHSDHSLERIGVVSTSSSIPCHIELDSSGKYLFVSNYMGGVLAVYKRNTGGAADLVQTLKVENASGAHLHSATVASDNKYVYVADLGNNKIWIYNLDASRGKLTPHEQVSVKLKEGAGPRHFTVSKDGSFAYSINELDSSVSVFKVLSGGGLKVVQHISSLPKDFTGENFPADIHLHPSGEFLYASNRGHNSIVAYKVNNGRLDLLGFTSTLGETPRNFTLSPQGSFLYVANQDSDSIIVFEVDSENGELKEAIESVMVKTPVCLEF